MCLLHARRALKWKSMDCPSPAMVTGDGVLPCAGEMNLCGQFSEIWDIFMQFLESNQADMNELNLQTDK